MPSTGWKPQEYKALVIIDTYFLYRRKATKDGIKDLIWTPCQSITAKKIFIVEV